MKFENLDFFFVVNSIKIHGNKGRIFTPEHKWKLSLAKIGKHHTPETTYKIRLSNIGKVRTEKQKQKMSLAKQGKKRKPFTEETRKKMSESKKGKKNPLGHLGCKHSLQTRKKMSESKKGKPAWNKKIPHTEEHKKNLSIAQRKRFSKNNLPWKDTKPEQEAESILKKYNLNYKKQKALKYKDTGKFYDFYLPDYNILLEVDGIFWHGKGIKDKDIKNIRVKQNRINDHIKDKLAQDNGYTLIRIWEDEMFKLENYCSKELNLTSKLK